MNNVVIPCPHNNKQGVRKSSSSSSKCTSSSATKKLTVKISLQSHETLVYEDHINSRRLYHYHPLDLITFAAYSPRNPLCRRCKTQFIDFLRKYGWSTLEAHEEFDSFHQEVIDQLFILRNDKDRRRKTFEHLYRINQLVDDRVIYDEEAFWRLVGDGEVFGEMVEEVAVGTVRASESAIKGLERVVKKVDVRELLKGDNNSCGICLQELVVMKKNNNVKENDGDGDDDDDDGSMMMTMRRKIVKLPCKHVFHEGCVRKWLHKNHVCPFCRFELPSVNV